MGNMVLVNGFVIEDGVLVGYHGNEEHVIIPDGVTKIGKHAFRKNHRIKSVYIPAGVISIGNSAFYDCYSLERVSIPAGMTKLGVWVFKRCFNLDNVILPESVTFIGKCAFEERIGSGTCCFGTTITAPIGSYAESYAKENNIPLV